MPTANLTDGFEIFTQIFTETKVFNLEWVFSIFLVMITLILITREAEKWKQLALPVTIAWHIAGITPHYLWYMITTILFVIDVLSIQTISTTIGNITRKLTGAEIRQKQKALEASIMKSHQKQATTGFFAKLTEERKEHEKKTGIKLPDLSIRAIKEAVEKARPRKTKTSSKILEDYWLKRRNKKI